MITIVEPKEHITKIWGKQKVDKDATYRLMKYVLRVEHDGKVLLHNVVTGQLVVLDSNETKAIHRSEIHYSCDIEHLILNHFLVPIQYDEHQQVLNLRNILWKLTEAIKPKEVTSYLILPTTACNARCWYCFEKDVAPTTMTEETANDVVNFIVDHCCGKPIQIWWFGGEPTLAARRIDQICKGLQQRSISYFSDISTNGYLFDDDMIDRAKNLWKVRQVTVSLDGTEASYNRVKGFQGVKDNPYQKTMKNVKLLLERGIAVALRMNYDRNTYMDFAKLLQEVKERFPEDSTLMVYPHQINQDYYDEDECRSAQEWFGEKNKELKELARSVGLYNRKNTELPSLIYEMCGAANGRWFVITPLGQLVCCAEQIKDSQIKGDIRHGITNLDLENSWKKFSDHEECQNCALFPRCAKMMYCATSKMCYNKTGSIALTLDAIKNAYNSFYSKEIF